MNKYFKIYFVDILKTIMLINKNVHGYSKNKKYVVGRGFVDSLSTIFNSLKSSAMPALQSVGSYVSNNKDLIAKPVLGAIGSLAATGLTAGVPALLSHIKSKNKNRQLKTEPEIPDDPKYKEILQSILASTPQEKPVTNIIGSGVHTSRRRGAGIKRF
jgi:hypothetical protein